MRDNLQANLQWLRNQPPLPKHKPPSKKWRPNDLEEVIQKFDSRKAIQQLQRGWVSKEIGQSKKPLQAAEREFGTSRPKPKRKPSFDNNCATVKKQKLNDGASKKTFTIPEPRDRRKSRSSLMSVGSDQGSQSTQSSVNNSFSIEQTPVFASASILKKKKVTPVFGSKKPKPPFHPSNGHAHPPKKKKPPRFSRSNSSSSEKPVALPPPHFSKPKGRPPQFGNSFQQRNNSISQPQGFGRNNPGMHRKFQPMQSSQRQHFQPSPPIQSSQMQQFQPAAPMQSSQMPQFQPAAPAQPGETDPQDIGTKYIAVYFDFRDILYKIYELPEDKRYMGHCKRKSLEQQLKRKKKEKKLYERQYGGILDSMKGSMEESWDRCDEEIALVCKIIESVDRGKKPSDHRINRIKKYRKDGDDFHEHLEAMMYDETEEDEEMEKQAQSQPVMNNYSKQPVHHFSTQPPNIIASNSFNSAPQNSFSNGSHSFSNAPANSSSNAPSNSFSNTSANSLPNASMNSSVNSSWHLDHSLPNESQVQLQSQSFMSEPPNQSFNEPVQNFQSNFDNSFQQSNQFAQPDFQPEERVYENTGEAKPWEVDNPNAVSRNHEGCIHNVQTHKFKVSINNWTHVHDFDTQMKAILRERWRYSSFRPNQREIMTATLSGRDVFAILPTGSGKSMCFQLPAVLEQRVTIVISPLLALIEDQVWELQQIGVAADSIGSQHDFDTNKETLKRFKNGEIILLYCTPEKLVSNKYFQHCISKVREDDKLGRFVIDEAHCASQWGHDFRPEYTQLDIIRNAWPDIPILACTATASETVKSEVASILRIPDCEYFQHTFNRPNITLSVMNKQKNPVQQIVDIIQQRPRQCGIIYCLAIKEVEKVHMTITANGVKAAMYHGQMDNNFRSQNHMLWKNGKVDVIVATVAFGMGINKPDVRYVIHSTIPKSIEDYYQQAGRAGRDGRPSEAICLYGAKDRFRCSFIIKLPSDDGTPKSHDRIAMEMGRLWDMVLYCMNDAACRRTAIMGYFGEDFDRKNCNKTCDVCSGGMKRMEDVDFTEHAKQVCSVVRKCHAAQRDWNNRRRGKSQFVLCLATTSRVEKVMRGNKDKFFEQCGVHQWPEYGVMKKHPVYVLKCLMFTLMKEGYLGEETELTNKGGRISHLSLRGKGRSLIDDETATSIKRIMLRVPAGGKKRSRKSPKKKAREIARAPPKKKIQDRFFMQKIEHKGYTNEMQAMLFKELKRQVRANLVCRGVITKLFSDEEVWNMTCVLPVTLDDMINHCKCKRFPCVNFGEKFTSHIFDFIMNNGIDRLTLPEVDPIGSLSQFKKPELSSDGSDFDEADFKHGTTSRKKKPKKPTTKKFGKNARNRKKSGGWMISKGRRRKLSTT